jgi:hypothetical protein
LVFGTPEPGRKSIAQGESKVATEAIANGSSDGCALDDGAALQAAMTRSSRAWIGRSIIGWSLAKKKPAMNASEGA